MRNSRVKVNRQVGGNPFSGQHNPQSYPCPEASEYGQERPPMRVNTFESNYNYLINKMGGEKQLKTEERQSNQIHQRFASLGNSRKTSGYGQQIFSSASTPYLQFHGNQIKTQEQTPKMTSRNEPMVVSSSQMSKCSNKLSMRNAFKDYSNNNENISCVRESEASTFHQTTNNAAKGAQQRLKNDQILKYFQTKLQKTVSEFKFQLNEQSLTISSLQNQLKSLNSKLKEKEELITRLNLSISQKKQSEFPIKIKNLENALRLVDGKLIQQGEFQAKLNIKLNNVMEGMLRLLDQKRKSFQPSENLLKSFQKTKQLFKENLNTIREFLSIGKLVSRIKQHSESIKTNLKLIKNAPKDQQQAKRQLNDSASYFFHPSQLSNMDKFTELFLNRQGQPIQCYTDKKNQVKYKDTHTFMFNKKGDVVTLTENQKRYYVDKGFIACME